MIRHAFALFAVLATPACYWSNPPEHPYRHADLDPAKAELLATTPPAPPSLASPRVIVLGRFDSIITQPIGGLYDRNDFSVSPLLRTYSFPHAHLEVFEHTCDALRAAGLDVRKDYGSTGSPAMIESPLRALLPAIVRTRVLSLQHDQLRTEGDPPVDWELATLTVQVEVLGYDGVRRYAASYTIDGKVAVQESANLLRLIGLKLGARLTSDAAFLRAIEATARGAS